MIDQATLKKLLHYDPETGVFTWRERKANGNPKISAWNTRFATKEAGCVCGNGYNMISLKIAGYDRLYAHRLAMIYMGKSLNGMQVDHINGIRTDNRFSNLRLTTPSGNAKNAISNGNSSGFCGVYYDKRKSSKRWYVKHGDNIWGGSYATKEDAIKARLEINRRFGYTQRHGSNKKGA